jgi:nitrogen fixation NifU-like protein
MANEGYSPQLIDHFEHPRNAGAMEGADAEAYVTNPVCGDSMRIFLRIDDGRVAAASFLTSGCPAAIGTSSAATELVQGRTLADAAALTRDDYAEAVGGLPKAKLHCSVLAAAAVRQAIEDWERAQSAPRSPERAAEASS